MKWVNEFHQILWKGVSLGADPQNQRKAALKARRRRATTELRVSSVETCLFWEDALSLDDHSSCWDVGKGWEMTRVIVLPEALEEIGVLKPEFTNDLGWFIYIFFFLKDSCWNPRRFVGMSAKWFSTHVNIRVKREMKPII